MLWSLPMRERGLKPVFPCNSPHANPVAPRAGAWIETIGENHQQLSIVAPHAGAWIETAIGRPA